MKSKKGFQFFPFPEKIMGTSIFSGNGKNHANIQFFLEMEKIMREHLIFLLAALA
jgi:hypothetical protein